MSRRTVSMLLQSGTWTVDAGVMARCAVGNGPRLPRGPDRIADLAALEHRRAIQRLLARGARGGIEGAAFSGVGNDDGGDFATVAGQQDVGHAYFRRTTPMSLRTYFS
jgi:hypothetical protein